MKLHQMPIAIQCTGKRNHLKYKKVKFLRNESDLAILSAQVLYKTNAIVIYTATYDRRETSSFT